QVLERTAGLKKVAIRKLPEGGTVGEQLSSELAEQLCLDDSQLEQLHQLAGRCEEVYGRDRDIEWAFAGGRLYLLQCRAITRMGGAAVPSAGAPVEVVRGVRLL